MHSYDHKFKTMTGKTSKNFRAYNVRVFDMMFNNSNDKTILENQIVLLCDLLLQTKNQGLVLNLWPQLWTEGPRLLFS